MALSTEIQEKVFVGVFDKNYQALCLYATRFVGDFAEAEDLVQEVFVRFWEINKANPMTVSARAYLYRMTRNTCIDRMRQQRYQMVDIEKMADQLEYFFRPESEEDSKIDLVIEAIKVLPEKCRQVFTAVCVNGRRYKDVADEMQVSVNTIKTQLARALKLLREALHKEDFDLFLLFFVKFR